MQENKKAITHIAKMLRKNMTREEKHLWYDFLNFYYPKFYRQKAIGRYVADFYCAKAKLVIELDGSGHDTPKGQTEDMRRTLFLESLGLAVLRIPNFEIRTNFDNICDHIDYIVKSRLWENGRNDKEQ